MKKLGKFSASLLILVSMLMGCGKELVQLPKTEQQAKTENVLSIYSETTTFTTSPSNVSLSTSASGETFAVTDKTSLLTQVSDSTTADKSVVTSTKSSYKPSTVTTTSVSTTVVGAITKRTTTSSITTDAPKTMVTQSTTVATTQAVVQQDYHGQLVWIPNSGSKYHIRSGCSGMKNPSQVSVQEAINLGYEPCKRCYR